MRGICIWLVWFGAVSRRCIPFGWSKEDLAEINGFIAESSLEEAVNNVQLLANINGVGFCVF